MEKVFVRRHGWLLLAVFVFVVVAISLAWLRYVGLRSVMIDLGLFDQAIWEFSRVGVPFSSLVVGEGVGNFLGFHFAPLILIFAPFYYFIDSAFFLQVMQVLFVVSAVFPIYLSARVLGLSKNMSSGMVLLFLLHPFCLSGVVWDFHEVSLAVPLLSWALYAVLARKFCLLVFVSVLLLLVKEHYGVTVAALGILWALRYRKMGRVEIGKGALLFFGGLIALFLILFEVMPYFSGLDEHVMLSSDSDQMVGLARYSWLHLPFKEAVSVFMEHILLTPAMGLYLGLVFLSFWRLSLGGFLLFAAASADLLAALLSGNAMPRSPLAYHLLPILPVMVIAAAEGLSKIKSKLEQGKQFRMALVLTCCIFWVFAPLPLPAGSDVWGFSTLMKRGEVSFVMEDEVSEIRGLLRDDDIVVAQENIGSFFARRDFIYPLSNGYYGADKVILHLDYPYDNFGVMPFSNPFVGADWLIMLQELGRDGDFGLIYFEDDWAVFEKGADIVDDGYLDNYQERLLYLEERFGEGA